MAEDFNSPDDIIKQWVEAGKKEDDNSFDFSVAAPMDITVYLNNGRNPEIFENAKLVDIGSRVIVRDGERLSVFPEASVAMYEAEPSAVEESDEE